MRLLTMNAPALLIQTSIDQDGDGTPETITSETYSTGNKLLKRVFDGNADGQVDAIATLTYDDSGNQTGFFFDLADDGSVDYSLTTDYATDSAGSLTVTATSRDTTGSDAIYISKYNSDGNLIEEAVGTPDGGTEVSATYAYNDAGQITAYETNTNRVEYTYNEAGQITSYGTTNNLSKYTYDTAGRISSFTSPFAGSSDYFYDEAGNLARQRLTSSGFTINNSYTYGAENRLVYIGSSFSGGIRPVTSGTSYTYNAAGQVTLISSAPQGLLYNVGQRSTYEYDEAGNFIRETLGRYGAPGGNGPFRITEYSYDEAGRVTSQSIDDDADGTFDNITSYAYDDLLTGGADQVSASEIQLGSVIEADIFADDAIAQVALGTGDVFSSGELVSSGLLESSILLESEAGVMLTDQFSI